MKFTEGQRVEIQSQDYPALNGMITRIDRTDYNEQGPFYWLKDTVIPFQESALREAPEVVGWSNCGFIPEGI